MNHRKLCLAVLILTAFLSIAFAALCFAAEGMPRHDGKTAMTKFDLTYAITNGLELAGYEATPERVALLLETAAAESRMGKYDVPFKLNGSYGVFQITAATATDTLDWLKRSDWNMWRHVMEKVFDPSDPNIVNNLMFNVPFAAVVAWLVYRRMAKPSDADLSTRQKRAGLWKRVYNTPLGAGTEAGYLKAVKQCLDGE